MHAIIETHFPLFLHCLCPKYTILYFVFLTACEAQTRVYSYTANDDLPSVLQLLHIAKLLSHLDTMKSLHSGHNRLEFRLRQRAVSRAPCRHTPNSSTPGQPAVASDRRASRWMVKRTSRLLIRPVGRSHLLDRG